MLSTTLSDLKNIFELPLDLTCVLFHSSNERTLAPRHLIARVPITLFSFASLRNSSKSDWCSLSDIDIHLKQDTRMVLPSLVRTFAALTMKAVDSLLFDRIRATRMSPILVMTCPCFRKGFCQHQLFHLQVDELSGQALLVQCSCQHESVAYHPAD
jgi:hypothetical protein